MKNLHWFKFTSVKMILGIWIFVNSLGLSNLLAGDVKEYVDSLLHRGGSSLSSGEIMWRGQYICSPNRKYKLKMQADGNLCLYQASYGGSEQFVWCMGKHSYGQNYRTGLRMQRDGNMVVYRNARYKRGYVWSALHRSRRSGYYTLYLRNNRNLEIVSDYNQCIWESRTKLRWRSETPYYFYDC